MLPTFVQRKECREVLLFQRRNFWGSSVSIDPFSSQGSAFSSQGSAFSLLGDMIDVFGGDRYASFLDV